MIFIIVTMTNLLQSSCIMLYKILSSEFCRHGRLNNRQCFLHTLPGYCSQDGTLDGTQDETQAGTQDGSQDETQDGTQDGTQDKIYCCFSHRYDILRKIKQKT